VLETLAAIVSLAKLGEAHEQALHSTIILLALEDDAWTSTGDICFGLLSRVRGSLAIVGIDPNEWAGLGRLSAEQITWA